MSTPAPLILLVGNDPAIHELLGIFLETKGYQVFPSANGRQALSFLRAQAAPVALVILELQMAGMDGMQLIEAIRHDLKLKLPLLALSDSADAQHWRLAVDAGAFACLGKPLELTVLIDQLDSVLKHKGCEEAERP